MSTGKKWKKVKSGEPDVEIDYELINNWTVYAKQLGLTDIESLGMAYFIAAIPTVTSIAKEDIFCLSPFRKLFQTSCILQMREQIFYIFIGVLFQCFH